MSTRYKGDKPMHNRTLSVVEFSQCVVKAKILNKVAEGALEVDFGVLLGIELGGLFNIRNLFDI